MQCRSHCGACCIYPSISSPIPQMEQGKAAGVSCIQLDQHRRCKIFGKASRPEVCLQFTPTPQSCGSNFEEAKSILISLEKATKPDAC